MQTILARLQSALNQSTSTLSAKSPSIIMACLVLGVFLLLALGAPRLLRRILRKANTPTEVVRVAERVIFFSLLLLGVFAALNELDVNLGTFGIEVSLLGVAAGFALKDLLTNMVSGLLILSSRPFVVGDQIRIKDFEGTVATVGWRGTTLITYDGRHIIIPNTDVFTNPVINNTASPLRRHSIMMGVSSDVDMARVRQIILEALAQMPDVAEDPAPDVLVSAIGDFDTKLEIRIWSAALQSEVKRINSDATQVIYTVLATNKVEMPLPTQLVKIQTLSTPE